MMSQSVRRLARDDVCLSSLPRIPVVAVRFDKRLAANPNRPCHCVVSPPASGYSDFDEGGRVGCQPGPLELLVFVGPGVAVELNQCTEPLFPGHSLSGHATQFL